jgi:hypothetical protein
MKKIYNLQLITLKKERNLLDFFAADSLIMETGRSIHIHEVPHLTPPPSRLGTASRLTTASPLPAASQLPETSPLSRAKAQHIQGLALHLSNYIQQFDPSLSTKPK